MDRESFARQRARLPRLQSLEDRGGRLYPHMGSLCLDLYAALYKNNVVLRPEGARPTSAAVGCSVVRAVLASGGYETLREVTVLDESRAATSVVVLGRLVLGLLKEEEIATAEDLERAARLAHEEEAIERGQEALDVAREAGAGFGDEARRRLEVLAGALEDRRQALAESQEEARRAADLPATAESRIRQTVDGLSDRLDDAEAEAEAWGRGVGAFGRVSATERLELGEHIASSESLKRLALLAGAFRDFARAERRRRVARRAAETHDVVLGDDWARMLPAELVLLRHDLLGRALRRRALEGELAVYRLEGPDDRGRGPLVVCLDGSGSMQGKRDLWAKAVALALMDIARRQRRSCRVVSFSDGERSLRSFDLLRGSRFSVRREANLAEVVGLAEHFPGGGTDFVAPLRKALESLRESTYRKGDIVFVTDGEASIPGEFLEEYGRDHEDLGFRAFGVLVDVDRTARHRGIEVLSSFCDDVTTVTRLTAESVRDLFVKI